MFKKAVLVSMLSLGVLGYGQAREIASNVDAAAVPKSKQTTLALYLAPADAHVAMQADPGVIFLDVRDPVEISYVGHPEGIDANVPLELVTHRFNAKKGQYEMAKNRDFVAQVDAVVAREGGDKSTSIFLICRSGKRSARAARMLHEVGYTSVWNLVEGFEGDMDKETRTRSVNGWRNAGLPWRYKIPAGAGWASP